MRIIDIYQEDSTSDTGFRLIGTDFIQTGENSLSRARNAKTFTMADGSLMMYTAEKDKNQITLKLECTEEQADLLGDAERYGKLLFAGIHAGTKKTPSPTDRNYAESEKKAFAGYLTGTSTAKQISSDLYALEIPLQIDFSDMPTIPVIWTNELKLFDRIQSFSDFVYQKDGFFHRKQTIFTSEGHIPVSLPVHFPEFSAYVQGTIYRNGELCWSWGDLTHQSVGEVDVILPAGLNQIKVILRHAERICKPLKIEFRAYQYP